MGNYSDKAQPTVAVQDAFKGTWKRGLSIDTQLIEEDHVRRRRRTQSTREIEVAQEAKIGLINQSARIFGTDNTIETQEKASLAVRNSCAHI